MDELAGIKNTLQKLEKLLRGLNYVLHFKLECIVESTDITVARDILRTRDTVGWLPDYAIEPTSYEECKTEINAKLLYKGDESAGPRLSKSKEKQLHHELHTLWALLEQSFAPGTTAIYLHPETEIGAHWGFCFLLVSHTEGKIYMFQGISSD